MQQEFADYKKRNDEKMEALKEMNARLKRKVEVDRQLKGKEVNDTVHEGQRMSAHEMKEESEYNPTQRTKGVTNNSLVSKKSHRHPFVDGITETTLPKQWKASTVCYDSSTNPNKYIYVYTTRSTSTQPMMSSYVRHFLLI